MLTSVQHPTINSDDFKGNVKNKNKTLFLTITTARKCLVQTNAQFPCMTLSLYCLGRRQFQDTDLKHKR
jgi:hypothetical protein